MFRFSYHSLTVLSSSGSHARYRIALNHYVPLGNSRPWQFPRHSLFIVSLKALSSTGQAFFRKSFIYNWIFFSMIRLGLCKKDHWGKVLFSAHQLDFDHLLKVVCQISLFLSPYFIPLYLRWVHYLQTTAEQWRVVLYLLDNGISM